MDDAEPIPCNLPFERLPACHCDTGKGDPPTKLQMMECRIRGGMCAPDYFERNPQPRVKR
jgi:hypothetical protein